MLNFTIYTADCVGNRGNCLYPNKMIVTDKESFIKATKMDHVTAKYKANYRSKDNFESSDGIPLDCDNDHSDNQNEWVTPLDIALEIPGVAFAVSYSRHHNILKGDKSARPRFHIFFPIEIVSDEQEYADMKRRIADVFPYYDINALDSARFLYGNDSDEVEFYEGDKTIFDYLEEDDFADFDASLEQVPEGQRNNTMSHIAGKIIKRYRNTEDLYQIFLKKAELCNAPLPESELKVIWRSVSKFGNKVSNQKGYIPPEQYNSDYRLKPEDFSDAGQATVLATEYRDILCYSPSTDYIVYNGSFWEESKPKSQGVSQDLTERQLAEAEIEMKKAMDELVKNGGMEILVSVGSKKAVHMFNKQQAHAYEMYEDASVYKKYEGVGAVLGLEKQKLTEGKNLIKYFCVPCSSTKVNGGRTRNMPYHDLEKWTQFKAYNLRDVKTEMGIQKKLLRFLVSETIWDEHHLDQEINDRGIGDIFFKRKQAELQNMMSNWSEGLLKKSQFMMIN